MICEKCGVEMEECSIIGFNKVITVCYECPICGEIEDMDDDQ